MPQTVAVLGTGIMGAPMARNIAAAGARVRVWNRTPEKAARLAGAHIEVAGSPADAVRWAPVVVTVLADADAVEKTILTARPGLERNALWLQMSTVGLDSDHLAAVAQEARLTYVDAPVLGSRWSADVGELVVLASGPDDARGGAAEVLDAVARRTLWVGPAGTGSRLKLVVNAWMLGLLGALAESVALAETLGVAPTAFLDAVQGGPTGAPFARAKGRMMLERHYDTAFPLRLALKDAHLVLSAGGEPRRVRLAGAVAEHLAAAVAAGHGDEDMAAVVEALRR